MILRNIIITIFIFLTAWIIFSPCKNSYRANDGKIYRASSSKTAKVLQLLENISDDFANRVKAVNPELGNKLIGRLVNTTFVELDHIENSTTWAWNVEKGRELAFRFYKKNGNLEPPEEQICSLLHELAHSVIKEYDHGASWQEMNDYFQEFPYENGVRIKDHYITLLAKEELYEGVQVNPTAICDGKSPITD
jgi:hypothetical protein